MYRGPPFPFPFAFPLSFPFVVSCGKCVSLVAVVVCASASNHEMILSLSSCVASAGHGLMMSLVSASLLCCLSMFVLRWAITASWWSSIASLCLLSSMVFLCMSLMRVSLQFVGRLWPHLLVVLHLVPMPASFA